MSNNKNLWVLHLPEEDFVDCLNSVVHFTGIKIADEFLISENKDLLRLVGEKIKEYAEKKRLNNMTHYWLVHSLNRSRETLSNIWNWLKDKIPLEEDVIYLPESILSMVNDIIADDSIKIPLFDTRFIPRELFGQCVQVVWKENEHYEKRFAEEILHPVNGIKPVLTVRTVYHDTAIPPLDAYFIEIKEEIV